MNHVQKQKLLWRSRRSILELDLYFNRFIESGLFDKLTSEELMLYKDILTYEDQYLLSLFSRNIVTDNKEIQSLINKIILI